MSATSCGDSLASVVLAAGPGINCDAAATTWFSFLRKAVSADAATETIGDTAAAAAAAGACAVAAEMTPGVAQLLETDRAAGDEPGLMSGRRGMATPGERTCCTSKQSRQPH